MLATVLFPQEKPCDPFAMQFAVGLRLVREIRDRCADRFFLPKEELFQLHITEVGRKWPAQLRTLGTFDVILHGRAGHLDAATDVSVTEVEIKLESKNFPDVSHSHTLFGHPSG